MQKKYFFIVNNEGYILPLPFDDYEKAAANCDSGEAVFLAESLEELEYCLKLSDIEIT